MWYYTVNNQPVGPVDEKKLKQLLTSQSLNANSLVWKEGMAEWRPLAQTELTKLLSGMTVPPTPTVYVPDPASLLKTQEARNLYDLTKWYKFLGFSYIFLFLLYKGWEAVPDNSRGLKAWKAVGQLFIPLFNFYWIFTGIKGLPKELNDYVTKHKVQAPPLSEDLALWLCILSLCCIAGFIPFLGWVIAPLASIGVLVITIIFMNDLKRTLIAIAESKAK
jgi:hypothetical protein